MSLSLIKQFLEGKIPPVVSVILVTIFLLIALWVKQSEVESRLRDIEDFILIHEALEVHNEKHNAD